MASTEFPLPRKGTPFGLISDPKIPVAVKTPGGYVTFRFLLDTGADFSAAPRRLAQQVGLDWNTLPAAHVAGIGEREIQARLGHLSLRVGSTEIAVRCLYLDWPTAPFILGRADFLDRFVLTIDQPRQTITLSES